MNYPNGSKKTFTRKQTTANRGMDLESDINATNDYYRVHDIAIIYKKPTPITVNKVDYHAKNDAVIKEAHFLVPSTTDYNGIYKGMYIDFEAKETKNTSFPLSNIHPHQIKHLESIAKHGGIGFLIVRFTQTMETYLLEIEKFLIFINNEKRKSIPKEYFEKYGYLITLKYLPRLDYLKIVDKIRSV